MQKVTSFIPKSSKDWDGIFHTALVFITVILIYFLIDRGLIVFAFLPYFLSKWRVLAVQPRYWVPNIRGNLPDIIVGLGFINQMYVSSQLVSGRTGYMILWSVLFLGWLLLLKPRSGNAYVAAQAMIALVFGLHTIFSISDHLNEILVVISSWAIGLSAARHFVDSYEEPFKRLISQVWGIFIAALAFLLNRWLVVFDIFPALVVPQIAIVVALWSYVFGSIYHQQKEGKLSKGYLKQILAFACVIMVMLILFSNWNPSI